MNNDDRVLLVLFIIAVVVLGVFILFASRARAGEVARVPFDELMPTDCLPTPFFEGNHSTGQTLNPLLGGATTSNRPLPNETGKPFVKIASAAEGVRIGQRLNDTHTPWGIAQPLPEPPENQRQESLGAIWQDLIGIPTLPIELYTDPISCNEQDTFFYSGFLYPMGRGCPINSGRRFGWGTMQFVAVNEDGSERSLFPGEGFRSAFGHMHGAFFERNAGEFNMDPGFVQTSRQGGLTYTFRFFFADGSWDDFHYSPDVDQCEVWSDEPYPITAFEVSALAKSPTDADWPRRCAQWKPRARASNGAARTDLAFAVVSGELVSWSLHSIDGGRFAINGAGPFQGSTVDSTPGETFCLGERVGSTVIPEATAAQIYEKASGSAQIHFSATACGNHNHLSSSAAAGRPPIACENTCACAGATSTELCQLADTGSLECGTVVPGTLGPGEDFIVEEPPIEPEPQPLHPYCLSGVIGDTNNDGRVNLADVGRMNLELSRSGGTIQCRQ